MTRDEIAQAMQDLAGNSWGNEAHFQRFAALVAAASEEQWKHAVINELVCCHIYNAAHDNDPRKALHDAIRWNVQMAIDPQVSSDAKALIDRSAAAEREAICQLVYGMCGSDNDAERIVRAIRARGDGLVQWTHKQND